MQQVLREPLQNINIKKRPHHKQSADTGTLQDKGLKNQDKEEKRKVWN